jgi:hypothetical protein
MPQRFNPLQAHLLFDPFTYREAMTISCRALLRGKMSVYVCVGLWQKNQIERYR